MYISVCQYFKQIITNVLRLYSSGYKVIIFFQIFQAPHKQNTNSDKCKLLSVKCLSYLTYSYYSQQIAHFGYYRNNIKIKQI